MPTGKAYDKALAVAQEIAQVSWASGKRSAHVHAWPHAKLLVNVEACCVLSGVPQLPGL